LNQSGGLLRCDSITQWFVVANLTRQMVWRVDATLAEFDSMTMDLALETPRNRNERFCLSY